MMRARRPAAPVPTEQQVQYAIRHALTMLGLRCERLNSGAMAATYKGRTRFLRFTFAGCTDLVALLPDGRTLWCECKRPGGKLTEDQAAFRDDCKRNNVPWVLGDSVDAVLSYLREIGVRCGR